MKWTVTLGDEGVYWYVAKTPVGDLSVEYPNPMRVMDWEARWHPFNHGEGEVVARAKRADDCKALAIEVMRKRAKSWGRAFR